MTVLKILFVLLLCVPVAYVALYLISDLVKQLNNSRSQKRKSTGSQQKTYGSTYDNRKTGQRR